MTFMTATTKSLRHIRLFGVWLTVVTVLSGCGAEAAPSRSMSSDLQSPTVSPSDLTPASTATSSPTLAPAPKPIVSTSATFNLLPTTPPAGFESTIVCDGDIGTSDAVAIVELKTGEEFVTTRVLRDYADPDAPRTACTFGEGNFYIEDLIDARHVLIHSEGIHAIVDLPEVRYHWFALPEVEDEYANFLAVSPSLDAVVWTRQRIVPEPFEIISRELVITTEAGDAFVAELPAIEGGRCGSPTDSNFADYHLGGRHYYALDQIFLQINALVVASGSESEMELVPPPDGRSEDDHVPTFPVWSPTDEVLYYRFGNDVMRWTPEGVSDLFLADTPWFHPSMTADGRYLAYVVESDLYLIDFTTDATPQLIRENVRYPVFVNGSQIWSLEAPETGCATDETVEWVYDVRDGSEGPSVIESVAEVWPQTSSNH